jgi:hypothetical protein
MTHNRSLATAIDSLSESIEKANVKITFGYGLAD